MVNPNGKNPIYKWKKFADYRVKQEDTEGESQKWPLYLEDAFLDALLLIPQMGRKKVRNGQVSYGRNVFFTEYLWRRHLLVNPDTDRTAKQEKEKHRMYRTRKQVSSHIQVLKALFSSHPLSHFFFPRKKEHTNNSEELKTNPVLLSLLAGHLPCQRPDYHYFSQLLSGASEVFLKPKTFRIYLSSSDATLRDDCVELSAEGDSCLIPDSWASEKIEANCGGMPFSGKEIPNEAKVSHPLPHEFTRKLSQKESTSIRDLTINSEGHFAEFHRKILDALAETDPAHEFTSRCMIGPCDIIQCEVVVDLHATTRMTAGSHLTGLIELQICRPELFGHEWYSIVSVIKPKELARGPVPDHGNQSSACKVYGLNNVKDTIKAPFPVESWVNTFTQLATYAAAEPQASDTSLGRRLETADELLAQVAMYHEIWTAPADNFSETKRTRRAIILWTFTSLHARYATAKINQRVSISAGTNWRYLSKIDPMSQDHQRRAYVFESSVKDVDSSERSSLKDHQAEEIHGSPKSSRSSFHNINHIHIDTTNIYNPPASLMNSSHVSKETNISHTVSHPMYLQSCTHNPVVDWNVSYVEQSQRQNYFLSLGLRHDFDRINQMAVQPPPWYRLADPLWNGPTVDPSGMSTISNHDPPFAYCHPPSSNLYERNNI